MHPIAIAVAALLPVFAMAKSDDMIRFYTDSGCENEALGQFSAVESDDLKACQTSYNINCDEIPDDKSCHLCATPDTVNRIPKGVLSASWNPSIGAGDSDPARAFVITPKNRNVDIPHGAAVVEGVSLFDNLLHPNDGNDGFPLTPERKNGHICFTAKEGALTLNDDDTWSGRFTWVNVDSLKQSS